jgi:hypothetical protein
MPNAEKLPATTRRCDDRQYHDNPDDDENGFDAHDGP